MFKCLFSSSFIEINSNKMPKKKTFFILKTDLNDADEEWLTDDVTLTAFLTVSMETEDTEYEYCDCVDEDVR